MRYSTSEDRLLLTLTTVEGPAHFFVTARFIGRLVQQWFSHGNCQITEDGWSAAVSTSSGKASANPVPDTPVPGAPADTSAPLINTSTLRIEGSISVLSFEVPNDAIYAIHMSVSESIQFLRALRTQCLGADWSLKHWPDWVQMMGSDHVVDLKPSIH